MSWQEIDWPALLRAGQIQVHSISATAGAGLQNQVSISAIPGKTLYLRRAIVTCGPVPTVVAGIVQITGITTDDTNPLQFIFTETASAGGWLDLNFLEEPLQASAVNSAITVTLPAIGSGAVSAISLVGWSL